MQTEDLSLTIDATETNFVTTTVTAIGGEVSFSKYVGANDTIRCDTQAALLTCTLCSRQPHDSSWSLGTTNPYVVYQATETIYASATGIVSSSDLSTTTGTANPTAAATTTSSAAANALYVVGYAGDGMGAGFPGLMALAACFATMGVALLSRRL
jgi:hypothetical protein